jgi:hypothetical protein
VCWVDGESRFSGGIRDLTQSTWLNAALHVRVRRPVGVGPDEIGGVIGHAARRIGQRHDLGTIVDLARRLPPKLRVPTRWRRRLTALASGDPTPAAPPGPRRGAGRLRHDATGRTTLGGCP